MYPGPQVEAAALENRRYGPPGQPEGPRLVQYTTVNITTDPPRDYIIWSFCCFLYSNPFCLGLAALIFSVRARDRKVVGDLQGAQHYGSTARCLNIISTVLVSILTLTVFIVTIALAAAAA
ncbi:dispanin subfamily A member 2b-like [Odontesthes bonariensis]|uniref:dispanin subfamily A member 2b-like n=1 Tax=Odontesthes bonariensis TaxID=219752 RepID=UPI003F58ADFF